MYFTEIVAIDQVNERQHDEGPEIQRHLAKVYVV